MSLMNTLTEVIILLQLITLQYRRPSDRSSQIDYEIEASRLIVVIECSPMNAILGLGSA
jgi:hypothetical protein